MNSFFSLICNFIHVFPSDIPYGQKRCNALQYLEIGEMGTIKCSVNGTFDAVLWYISNEEEAVAVFKESGKSGEGYERGEYDIDKDGSLVILNVTTQHDKVFLVKQVIQLTERYVEQTVVARTTGKLL